MSKQNEVITKTVTQQEYEAYLAANDFSNYTKSDPKEILKIEDLLELRSGILKDESYSVSKVICSCGKTLTFFDFLTTAISENSHSKLFLVHALLGNKYGFQKPRLVTCSACGDQHIAYYTTPNYSCPNGGITHLGTN
ncbi:hypothetical protein L9Z73_19475 [Pseudomonas sp. TNT11]|uniref:Uncharacterized protein n=1 Tax=Pseudomonas emilianonis TaxID=2915812 RepID=A0ABT0EL88_9PSED|nr:hypothetical protein [Pseudomonas emilianonis]MCK1786451.1 hypothetical protein [Pseudomonas emilianonis]